MEIKKVYMKDGRLAEERSYVDEEGHQVTELWTVEVSPLKLTEKVTEKKAEVVVERVVDKIDLNSGEVLERKVEAIEPTAKLELREHIGAEKQAASNCSSSSFVTKEELLQAMAQVMADAQEKKMSATGEEKKMSATGMLKKLSAKSIVEQRVMKQKTSSNMADLVLLGIILLGVGFVVYQFFI